MRTKRRKKKITTQVRGPQSKATQRNERWAMDFVADQLVGGRRFRVLTLVDLYSRECLALRAGSSLKGGDVAAVLEQLKQSGRKPETITVAKNTNGDAAGAAQGLQEFLDQGIRVVVGPTSSGEAQGALPLAIAGDALYRLSPTNDLLSQATLDLLREQGFQALVTVNREDLGNSEEASELRRLASASGISLQPAITYPTDMGSDFRGIADELAQAVTRAGGSPSVVAVALFGLDEVADLLADCSGYSELAGLTFYGSDGISQSSAIVDSPGPAFFAVQAGSFPSPLLSVPPEQQAQAQAISLEIGDTLPDAFALNGYDAVQIMVNAYKSDPSFAAGGAASRAAFARAADGYRGLTGSIELDSAGDRVSGHYTFWGVCSLSGLINWYDVGSWTPRSSTARQGTAVSNGCPS